MVRTVDRIPRHRQHPFGRARHDSRRGGHRQVGPVKVQHQRSAPRRIPIRASDGLHLTFVACGRQPIRRICRLREHLRSGINDFTTLVPAVHDPERIKSTRTAGTVRSSRKDEPHPINVQRCINCSFCRRHARAHRKRSTEGLPLFGSVLASIDRNAIRAFARRPLAHKRITRHGIRHDWRSDFHPNIA